MLINILDKYNLNLEYKEFFTNIITGLGIDKIYGNLKNIYTSLENVIIEFNSKYVPLKPYEEAPTFDEIITYVYKNLMYGLFGENSDRAEKDIKTIYEKILALKENDEIVDIVDEVVNKLMSFEIDLKLYIDNASYQEQTNKNISNLVKDLLTEYTNIYNWLVDFEGDLNNIANKTEKFALTYFGKYIEISDGIEILFDVIDKFRLTTIQKQNIIKYVDEYLLDKLPLILSDNLILYYPFL